MPLGAAADGMRKSGMPEWNVRVVTELLGYFASGAAATVTNAIPSLLGRPAISFEQFAKDHRAAFGAEVQLHATSQQTTKTPAQVAS